MKRTLIVLLCCVPLAVAACGVPGTAGPSSRAAAGPSEARPATAPAASPGTPTAAPPTAGQDDPVTPLPPFACSGQSTAGSTSATIRAVRLAAHPGFDRFVIEFDGAVPGYRVDRQDSASFLMDGSGKPVTLEGSAGLRVVLFPASAPYGGPKDLKARLPVMREAMQIGDFEGYASWGLGLSRAACLRVFTLGSPSRLVIDVQG